MLLSTQGAFIMNSQSWCHFKGIRSLSSILVSKTGKLPQEQVGSKKMADRVSREDHTEELRVDQLQLGLPAGQGYANAAGNDDHQGNPEHGLKDGDKKRSDYQAEEEVEGEQGSKKQAPQKSSDVDGQGPFGPDLLSRGSGSLRS